ncbi:MAG TPA: UDP-N-acetylmuramoyl-L-alanyl-D-glutamate--2,6-diaminopimelate ligase [Pseudomonadota bacterium]|nr:UDP-N-acetylmuramoyl-L-alanyl-D-glutamate--2,6-diaminopimelate ligase [Pseudomonadota bacterium]
MKLSQLLREVALRPNAATAFSTETDLDAIEIGDVREDSRQVQPGDLFVAVPGQTVDGHHFLSDAAQRGAKAAIVEQIRPDCKLIQIPVENATEALAQLAMNRYGRPSDSLTLVGITGTNGKTTSNFLVETLLEEADLRPGLLGTVLYRGPGVSQPAPFTTPTALLLHQTLAVMAEHGAKAVTMEVSSHALALGRLFGVRFRVAAFTNLTQDHLDLHGTMDEYFAAKCQLFHRHLLPAERGGRAVINVDDPWGRKLFDSLPAEQRIGFSVDGPADISIASERTIVEGISAVFRTPLGDVTIRSPLTGRFNLSNLALSVGIGVALGLSAVQIGRGLSRLSGVPGRLERVPSRRGPTVFVDYAHTPDALSRVLQTLRPLTRSGTKPSRLLVVFGCGGDRDAGKRPLMGQAAAEEADLVIVTSDNPRTEQPQRILDMIVEGVEKTGRLPLISSRSDLASATSGYLVEIDRRQAIVAAILAAQPDDVVLLAGKGHEDYQVIGTSKQHFDDREEAQKALALRPETQPRSGTPTPQVMPKLQPSIELPLERILSATAGRLVRGSTPRFAAVTIDSRSVTPGCLFVAIRGDRLDGHTFIAQALQNGCSGVLVEKDKLHLVPDQPGLTVVEVADTIVAIGQIARAHREAPEIAAKLKVIGVTGSSGKTSTKDLIAAIFAAHVQDSSEFIKTDGNLNNHLGVPLTLLRLRPGQRYAIVEMGMSARGEIAYLTSLCRPDVGVITNVGPAHLETLGTIENIAAAKGELFAGLSDGATAVFLDGHALVREQAMRAGALSTRLRLGLASCGTTAATHASVHVRLRREDIDGLHLEISFPQLPGSPSQTLHVPLIGAHQADNAALAAAAALALDVPPATIAAGLARVTPGKHRGQLLTIGGRRVLDDCYNANPSSVSAALRSLSGLRQGGQAIAVLGDMLELGPTEAELHAKVGRLAATLGIGKVITVGERAKHISSAAQSLGCDAIHVDSPQAAAAAVAVATQPGDVVLIKGSRGMALERVLEQLVTLLSPPPPASAG